MMGEELIYDPSPIQCRFHALTSIYKWFLGGVGSGKTLAGLHELLAAAEDNPGCDGVIGAPTYPMLRDVILPLWRTWVPRRLYEYYRSDQRIEWYTGQSFFLRSATEPDRSSGLNVGFGWLDEGALIATDALWRILQARMRQPAPHPRLFVTSTPNGMNWLARWFRSNRSVAKVIRCRTDDNKHLPEGFAARLRDSYGPEYSAAFLDAHIIDLRGMMWPIVARVHCSLSLDEMQRRAVRFFGGVDWGYSNPAALIVGGVGPDGEWMLCDEWYRAGVDRSSIARAAAELGRKWRVRTWYADHDPEGISHMQREGLAVLQADKDVIGGGQHVRSALSPRGDGRPRLYVGPWLKHWLGEQEGYVLPDGKEEPRGQNGDHIMDATRYMIYTHDQTEGPMGVESGRSGRKRAAPRDWADYR